MNKPLHPSAHYEAHDFISLFYDDLPTTWHDDLKAAQFEFELWLATFDVKRVEENLIGFALLKAARLRAQRYYVRELKQVHHTPADWSRFRFRLESALLRTVRANYDAIKHCYAWHELTTELASRFSGMDKDGYWLVNSN